jgi:tetratricopeptide (TPR) repeat protein
MTAVGGRATQLVYRKLSLIIFNHIHSMDRFISRAVFKKSVYLLLSLLFLFRCYPAKTQRLIIDSLKASLSSLHDTANVDCVNILSLTYSYLNADSAETFAQKAYNEASKLNYSRGIAMSMNNKAHIAGLTLHNFPAQERISLKMLQLYKGIRDQEVVEAGYMNLALALFCQSYFDRSDGVCKIIVQLAQKGGNKKELGEALAIMGSIRFETGDYEKSFSYFNQSLDIFKGIHDAYNTAILLVKVGDLYRLAGDQKTALDFYTKSLEYPIGTSLVWHPLHDLGDTYYSLSQYDSAFNAQDKYLQTIKSLTVKSSYTTFPKILAAEVSLDSGNYSNALKLLKENLEEAQHNNDKNQEMRSLLDMAKAYEGERNYDKAFYCVRILLQDAQDSKAKQYLRDGYSLMFKLFERSHLTDSAYFYYRRYSDMKDYVALGEFNKKLAIYEATAENEKKKSQIELLNNQQVIDQQKLQLSRQQVKTESFQKNILVGSILLLLLFGFIVFRNIILNRKNEATQRQIIEKELNLQKLESEKTKIELQQKAVELEMQALRSQMNPHFIFNCLNSINRFTLANEATKAADHLTKFAKLIRIVLQQSGKSFIPLEDELYSLQLYMDLEALRFEHPFSYTINADGIDLSTVMVPPLLLQPFVENAVWHGLHPKQTGEGMLCIDLKMQNEKLECAISDNGVGRNSQAEDAGESDAGKKSLGIKLTQNRLALFQSSFKQDEAVIVIDDLKNGEGKNVGTRVLIKIPINSV